ncbi:hypothetical protein ACC809_37880, partial [Rhizobium johnstonii]
PGVERQEIGADPSVRPAYEQGHGDGVKNRHDGVDYRLIEGEVQSWDLTLARLEELSIVPVSTLYRGP